MLEEPEPDLEVELELKDDVLCVGCCCANDCEGRFGAKHDTSGKIFIRNRI